MIPKKIIFYTRPREVLFHCKLARDLLLEYPDAPVLFVSFFSQAIKIAVEEGFETLYFPEALRKAQGKKVVPARLHEIDEYCKEKFMGLNAMLQTERFLPSGHQPARAFLEEHLWVLDHLIGDQVLGISSMYDHFVYLAAGLLAFQKGGAHFAFVGCGVPAERVVALRTPQEVWQHDRGEDTKKILADEQARLHLPAAERISYMRKLPAPPRRSWINRTKAIWRRRATASFDYKSGNYFNTSVRNWPFSPWKRLIKRALREPKKSTWDIVSATDFEGIDKPFVYLALHMEPEATILMYSPWIRDQAELTRWVSQSLPADCILLVKENPKMKGARTRSFYEKLKSYPNVFLVAPTFSSDFLLENCEAVVSLGGTVTVEAALKGRPAFTVGKPPFSAMATLSGLEVFQRLPSLVKSARDQVSFDEQAWQQWVRGTFEAEATWNKYSEQVGLMVQNYEDENVEKFATFITGAIGGVGGSGS